MRDNHTIAIQCRSCEEKWKLRIPLTGNKVEVFATLCPCSAIIVGNYNSIMIEEEIKGIKMKNEAISPDEKYLSNGHFDVLDLTDDEIESLPELALE